MNLATLFSLIRSGQVALLLSTAKAVRNYCRIAFLGAGLSSGVLRRLAAGPVSLEVLRVEMGVESSLQDGLEALLQLGVALGELRFKPEGYSLRGKLSRRLIDP